MKSTVFVLAAICCLQLNPLSPRANDQPLRLAVDLTDGSRVIGTSRNESIRIKTDFGNQQVSLRLVENVRWKHDREQVVLEFPNGDRLTGGIIPEVVHLNTLFGEAKISMEHIAMLKPVPAAFTSLQTLDGLVLYFSFDEQPEAGLVASRVSQLQGKQQGGQWIRQGHRGGSFHFTNADDGIMLTDHESLRPKKLTISVWVNPDSSTPHSSSYRGILAKGTSGSWSGGYGLARYPGNPDVHFFVNYYGGETAHASIPDNTWTHLVGTYDEQTLTLYVNGVKVSAVTPQSYGGPIQHGPTPLLIGQAPDGYGWFGKLDDVMLFNRVLSAAEISRLYHLSKAD